MNWKGNKKYFKPVLFFHSMLLKTHIVITLFGILVLLNSVSNKVVFAAVALIATFIPDIDSRYSSIGKKKINRILQFFTKHRGITHSFVFLILVTTGILFFSSVVALGFFLGYGLHLFADSFTKDGIKVFYPFFPKAKSSGRVSTGGKAEIIIFVVFLIFDLVILFGKISRFF